MKFGNLGTTKFGMGQSVRRVEDVRLTTGKGKYTDDVQFPGMLHGVTLRSPYAHARIQNVDISTARAMPGVKAILLGADVAHYGPLPNFVPLNPQAQTPRAILCADIVRCVGDPVAFVVAETLEQARAASEAIDIDYEELPVAASMDAAAQSGAPQLWASIDGNQAWTWEIGNGDAAQAAIAAAPHVVKLRVVQNRVAPTSMEVRAAVGRYDEAQGFTLNVGSQGVAMMRMGLANLVLKIDAEKLRIITEDVGGGFGMKSFLYHEYVLVLHAAKLLGAPVKWAGARSDAFLTDTHGRDLVTDVTIALEKSGKILALTADTKVNLGAYQGTFGNAIQTMAGGKMLGGVYDIAAIHNRVRGMLTNTAPTDAYRGAGRPEACYITERAIEAAARQLGIASDDIRRRNLLKPEQLPHTAPTGVIYDVGNYPQLLEAALKAADWHGFDARAAQSRAAGKLRGRGLCYYVEVAGGGGTEEFADARFLDNDIVEIAVGTQSNGQGHETAYAQVLHARLGVPFENIRVVQGDTARLKFGNGTGGSRSLQFGGGAVLAAADTIMEQARTLAVQELGGEDLDFHDGLFARRASNSTVSLFELARKYPQALDARGHYKTAQPTPVYPNGCHIAEVEIDADTGRVQVVKYDVVDDFGNIINPLLVEGQIHGGVAQGLGQILLEDLVYDESGQLLSGSFMDYGMPRADDMPPVQFDNLPHPNPNNPLGVKGCGEAGTIGAMPSIMNAITDALGGVFLDMPATPEKIWRALRSKAA